MALNCVSTFQSISFHSLQPSSSFMIPLEFEEIEKASFEDALMETPLESPFLFPPLSYFESCVCGQIWHLTADEYNLK